MIIATANKRFQKNYYTQITCRVDRFWAVIAFGIPWRLAWSGTCRSRYHNWRILTGRLLGKYISQIVYSGQNCAGHSKAAEYCTFAWRYGTSESCHKRGRINHGNIRRSGPTLFCTKKYGMKKSLRIFLWIQDAQKQSFMMQTQLGLNACNLQASGCSMLQLLLSGW